MNPFQEVILDRLIGAAHGEFQNHFGPVGLAFQALVDARLVDEKATALDLGYPLILRSALESACAMLRPVEQQRRLAVAVFAEVSPYSPPLPLTPRTQIGAALWCARRVHPLICRADCPFLQDAVTQIEQYLSTNDAVRPALQISPSVFHTCSASNEIVLDVVKGGMIALYNIGYQIIAKALEAARADRDSRSPESSSCEAAGYAAILAARFLGVQGATEFCVSLARELGV
jgi:hypothetical protein